MNREKSLLILIVRGFILFYQKNFSDKYVKTSGFSFVYYFFKHFEVSVPVFTK